MTKLVRVNTLAVAKRWYKQLRDERKSKNQKNRIGIWELPNQTQSEYLYSSNTRYVVGNSSAVKNRVRHLGERLDEESV